MTLSFDWTENNGGCTIALNASKATPQVIFDLFHLQTLGGFDVIDPDEGTETMYSLTDATPALSFDVIDPDEGTETLVAAVTSRVTLGFDVIDPDEGTETWER